jgi:AAA+ ATPase superfamily predicted ATPase
LGTNIYVLKKNREAVVVACKEVELEVNAEEVKYVVLSHQTTRQSLYINVANKSTEDVAEFKVQSKTLTNRIAVVRELRAD